MWRFIYERLPFDHFYSLKKDPDFVKNVSLKFVKDTFMNKLHYL